MGNMYRCQRFRAYLRRLEFLNPVNMRTVCRSLGEEYELSEHLKIFTYLAKLARQKFIDKVHDLLTKPVLLHLGQFRLQKKKKIRAKQRFC